MQVVCVGLGRTGTQSLALALKMLEIGPLYNMYNVATRDETNIFERAMDTKYEGKGRGFTRQDFDTYLSGYEAVSDIPAAVLAEDLIAAYPEAKVILTTRDVDSWYESMLATLWHSYQHSPQIDHPVKNMADRYQGLLWKGDFEKNGKAVYMAYNESIRTVTTPSSRLLEFEVKDGWGPLCEFLNKPIPDAPFPRHDDWIKYKERT